MKDWTDEQRTLNKKVAELHGALELFVIHKPKNDPFGYYRENAGGYTGSLLEAWKVTAEQGAKYSMYADAKPGSDAYYERVVLKPAPPVNYLTLDAIATVRATLSDAEQSRYVSLLCETLSVKHPFLFPISANLTQLWALLDATAEQHARAYVMVKEWPKRDDNAKPPSKIGELGNHDCEYQKDGAPCDHCGKTAAEAIRYFERNMGQS